jgi:predicted nucleic acid-binding protein
MTIVCDTSVLCYLALIDCVAVLPRRFGTVTIPREVAEQCVARSA